MKKPPLVDFTALARSRRLYLDPAFSRAYDREFIRLWGRDDLAAFLPRPELYIGPDDPTR